MDQADSSEASQTAPIKTKKLFITGLSFYTFEKTIRTAFEGFGELVEGYAFVEYTTDEAASTALKEMNGKEIYRALWIRRAQILQKQVKQPL